MTTISEHQIDAAVASELRKKSGLSQSRFWGAIGVGQSSGHRYENPSAEGMDTIPTPVKVLLFLRYVVGIPIDVTQHKWAEGFICLAEKLRQSEAA